MATIRVQVTAKDIADAPVSALEGPTVRAIRRAIPQAKKVRVGFKRLTIDDVSVPLPDEVRRFENRFFVSRVACRPFSFELELPVQAVA